MSEWGGNDRGLGGTYTDVGEEGIEAGEREPRRCVLRC